MYLWVTFQIPTISYIPKMADSYPREREGYQTAWKQRKRKDKATNPFPFPLFRERCPLPVFGILLGTLCKKALPWLAHEKIGHSVAFPMYFHSVLSGVHSKVDHWLYQVIVQVTVHLVDVCLPPGLLLNSEVAVPCFCKHPEVVRGPMPAGTE